MFQARKWPDLKAAETHTSFNPWSRRWLITGYWSVSHLNSLGIPILSPPAPIPRRANRPPLLNACRRVARTRQEDPAKEDRQEEDGASTTPRLPNLMILLLLLVLLVLVLLRGVAAPGTKKAAAGDVVEEHSKPTASDSSTRPLKWLPL